MGDIQSIPPHSPVWFWPSPPVVPEPKPAWEVVSGLTFRTLVTLRTRAPRVSLEPWELFCMGLMLPALRVWTASLGIPHIAALSTYLYSGADPP